MAQQQNFEIELPDGTIIEGPTKEAALIAARKKLGITAQQPNAIVQPQVQPEQRFQDIPSPSQQAAPIFRPLAGISAGLGAGLLTKSPTAGSATMSIVDEFLRAANKEKSGGIFTEKPSILGAAESTIENEITARGLELPMKLGKGLFNVGKELLSPGSGVPEDLLKLGPTYSQYKNRPFSSLIEDIFARTHKEAALVQSARAAKKEGENISSSLSGRTVPLNLENTGAELKLQAQLNKTEALRMADQKSEAVKLIAENNPITVSIPTSLAGTKQVISSIMGPDGKPVIQNIPVPAQFQKTIVKGPVNLNFTNAFIDKFKDEVAKAGVKPDEADPILKTLNELKAFANIQSPDGKWQISPAAFENVWATKKVLGQKAFESGDELPSNAKRIYANLYHSIDKDIENSMGRWANDPNIAQQHWQDMKSGLNSMYAAFYPQFEKGAKLSDWLNDTKETAPPLKAILDPNNVNKLQRTLDSGNIKFGDTVLGSDNMRRDLKSAKFQQLLTDAWTGTDAANTSSGRFNSDKLLADWAEYSQTEHGKKLFNIADRENISKFFNNVDKINESASAFGSSGPSRYLTLRLGSGTFQLGAGISSLLLGSGTLGPQSYFGAGILGASAGLHLLGRLMTNTKTASLMEAMASGSALGMSSQKAARMIAYGLRNEPISMILENGTQVKGTVDKDGKFKADLGLQGDKSK